MHDVTGPDYSFVPPFWPNDEERALLRAALLDDDRAIDSWATVDIAAALRSYASWSLLPLVFFNLKSLGVPMNDLPDAAAAFSSTSGNNQRLLTAAEDAMESLAGLGIESVMLKGAALASSAYPHPGTRPMFDLDILVRPTDAMTAAAMLAGQGFHPAVELTDAVLRTRASAQFVRSDGVDIDLHWHALGGYVADAFDDALWLGVRPVSDNSSVLKRLGQAEQLIHVVAHTLRNGKAGTHWWLDVALIIKDGWLPRHSEQLASLSTLFEMTLPLRGILRFVQREIGCEVPEGIFESLASPVPGRGEATRSRILARLDPDSTLAALIRSWATYSAVSRAEKRLAHPIGFVRFTWQYLGSSSSDPSALAAVRRKLQQPESEHL